MGIDLANLQTSSRQFWLGLTKNRKLLSYKRDSWSWISQAPYDYTNWHVGMPDVKESAECAALYIEYGTWSNSRVFVL
jgi:hypothetical protein